MEIRSYRRVFDLERRIYQVDQLRLNPAGVPLRGVIYSLACVALALVCDGLPIAGALLAPVPWFVRDLALPVACGSLLAAISIDGRRFDQAARALARHILSPRRLVSLRRSPPRARLAHWWPADVLVLPDGSEPRLRRLRFSGPGSVRLVARHEHGYTLGKAGFILHGGPTLVVRSPRDETRGDAGRVIVLDRGAFLRVA